jgi:NADH-quinone oxidoreductase subunit M
VGKAGLYGLLRIAIPVFPAVAHDWRYVLLVLASISLIYGSLLAFRAPDFRGVVMYSSLAQAGLIVLGLFAFNDLGFDGAVLQIVNHALVSSALFRSQGWWSAGPRPATSRSSAAWRVDDPPSRRSS